MEDQRLPTNFQKSQKNGIEAFTLRSRPDFALLRMSRQSSEFVEVLTPISNLNRKFKKCQEMPGCIRC